MEQTEKSGELSTTELEQMHAAQALYAEVAPALVAINTDVSRGTGFFVGQDGIILSAAHVVIDAKQIIVTTADGKRHRAKIVDVADTNDLVRLRLDEPAANYRGLELADQAAAAGTDVFSFAITKASRLPSISQGKTLGEQKLYSIVNQDLVARDYATLLPEVKKDWAEALSGYVTKTDIRVWPGDSGGPLVDVEGRVLGVTMLKEHGNQPVSYFRTLGDIRELLDRKRAKFDFKYSDETAVCRFLNGICTKPSVYSYRAQPAESVQDEPLPNLLLVDGDKLVSSCGRSVLTRTTRTDGQSRPPFKWKAINITSTASR